MEGPASIEHHGDHSVVRVVGEVDLANVSQVESTLRSAIGDASGPLVIDLSDLAYLDSAGVRALFAAARAAGDTGVSLRAALPPSSPVMRVLEVASFASRIPVYATVAEAAGAEA